MVQCGAEKERQNRNFLAGVGPGGSKNAPMEVLLVDDQAITIQQFMTVTDKLKDAGVERVAMATRPAGSGR